VPSSVKITQRSGEREKTNLDNGNTNGIVVDLSSLQLPSTDPVGTHHAGSGLRTNTAGAQADADEDEEAAAAMPLLPVRRRTAAAAGAGLAAADRAPLLQPQPGHHEARAW